MLNRYKQILESVVEGAKDKLDHGYVSIGHTEFEYTVKTITKDIQGGEHIQWEISIRNIETSKSVKWIWDAWFDKENNSLLPDVFLKKMDISRLIRLIMLTVPHYKYENRRRKRNKTLVKRFRKHVPTTKPETSNHPKPRKPKANKPRPPVEQKDMTKTQGLVSLGDVLENWK